MLRRRRINHVVLNAKFHQHEGEIIKDAGQPGRLRLPRTWPVAVPTSSSVPAWSKARAAIWSSTAAASASMGGGIGPMPQGRAVRAVHYRDERHEARRIDDQLRGARAGRATPFVAFLPLAGGRPDAAVWVRAVATLMDRFGAKDDEPIEHRAGHAGDRGRSKAGRGAQPGNRRHLLESTMS